jgi:hypothetical protein
VDGIGSGLCTVMGFGISDVEPSGLLSESYISNQLIAI